MELWLDLLFGNPVGLLSVITVLSTLGIVAYILWMFYYKSGHPDKPRSPAAQPTKRYRAVR